MEAVLGWLGSIFDFIVSLFPHLLIVRATHRGVKWRRGKKVIALEPGVHWWWPIVTEVMTIVVARQTTELESQTLTTTDRKTLIVRGVTVYSINDIILAAGEKNWDVDSTVDDISRAAIAEVISEHKWDELSTRLLREKSTALARAELKKFGVRVWMVKITDLALTRSISLAGLRSAEAEVDE